jgi:glycosyltransferase involved in cell wall biosynthesis
MRILWISDTAPAGLTTDVGHFARHRQAALRLRVGIPAGALAALGVESGFVGLDTPAVLEHLAPDRVAAVVFAKLSTPRGPAFDSFAAAYLGTADHARARGLGVIVDLVDNVFATDRADFFAALLARADAVTVPTPALADLCRARFHGAVQVIADPVEGERRPPRFAPPRRGPLSRLGLAAPRALRLLWFGGQYRNFIDLAQLFPALAALTATQPVELRVVMSRDERIARELAALGAGNLVARFAEWSLETVAAELERCDLVLLPANLQDAMRATASANRAVRALWAGRAVVAHPLPAYAALGDAVLLDERPIEALRRALADGDEVERRIGAGQALISERLSADAIGREWLAVLEPLAARQRYAPAGDEPSQAVRQVSR